MESSQKIRSWIVMSYVLIAVLVLGVMMGAVTGINHIHSLSGQLFHHPFQVRSAALKIKTEILEIHQSMLDIALANDPKRRTNLAGRIDVIEDEMRGNFVVIERNFLGDMDKVRELKFLFNEWSRFRKEHVEFSVENPPRKISPIVLVKGDLIFGRINGDIDYIVNFAEKKAIEYVKDSDSETVRIVQMVWFSLLLLFVVTGGVIYRVLKNVTNLLRVEGNLTFAVKENEKKFHTLFDSASDSFLILDKEGYIIDINRAGYERLGYEKGEMVGRRISEFDSPQSAAKVPERIHKLLTEGCIRCESVQTHKDGREIPVEISSRKVEIDNVLRFFSIIRDVTEQKKMQAKLLESENKFHALFEFSNDFKIILSMEGVIIDVNETCYRALGYAKEEMTGKQISAFVADEFLPGLLERVHTINANGAAIFDSAYVCRDGSVIPVEVSSKVVTLGSEKFHYSIVRDVTERKLMEDRIRRREEKYRAVVETLADGFWITDIDGNFIEVNDIYVNRSGYTREELLSMRVQDLEVGAENDDARNNIAKVVLEGHGRFESVHITKKGEEWPVEIVTNYWPISRGLFFSFISDITERKKNLEEIRLMARVFQNSVEAMLITDANNRIVKVNPAFTRLTGYTFEDVSGQDPGMLSAGEQDKLFYHRMWENIINEGEWHGEVRDRRKDGTEYPKWLSITSVRNQKGEIVNYIGNFSDITERKNAENAIRELAYHDTLTGLHNRLSLVSQLDHELTRARRSKTFLAVLFIDLDRFKTINDTLGHHVGDALLAEVANRLNHTIRESDLVARLGGDEFVVLLTEIVDKEQVSLVAEKIISSLSLPYDVEGHNVFTSPSIGISLFPGHGGDASSIMRSADMAMYVAKSEGGMRSCFFEPSMDFVATERIKIESSLKEALEKKQFRLFFQPLISRNGEVQGAEALIRWQHPQLGMMVPDRFIHVAEEMGLILQIGQWVLRNACQALRQWNDAGISNIIMAINISSIELLQEDLIGIVQKIVRDTGVNSHDLKLEIKESSAMKNPEQVLKILRTLNQNRIKLAIDDFGTGYSSLSYLARFPIDQLKIDHSFIRDIETDPTMKMVTLSTIALGKQLGCQVAVEGVENEKQSRFLFDEGCDLQQGFYFSTPLSSEEIVPYIRMRRRGGEKKAFID